MKSAARPPLTAKLKVALDASKAIGPTITGEICFRWVSPAFKAKGVSSLPPLCFDNARLQTNPLPVARLADNEHLALGQAQ
jgi:hypothetical protein